MCISSCGRKRRRLARPGKGYRRRPGCINTRTARTRLPRESCERRQESPAGGTAGSLRVYLERSTIWMGFSKGRLLSRRLLQAGARKRSRWLLSGGCWSRLLSCNSSFCLYRYETIIIIFPVDAFAFESRRPNRGPNREPAEEMNRIRSSHGVFARPASD